MTSDPSIGLALSGGGSRAIAFHLGCLRALNSWGILGNVKVLSTVSGGSVIGALYAAHDGSFEEFESKVRALLARGLLWPAIRKAFCTSEGVKAAFCWSILAIVNSFLFLVSRTAWLITLFLPANQRSKWRIDQWSPPIRRFASRTTILRRVLDDEIYRQLLLRDLPSSSPQLIINAADLRTGSAFYFSPPSSGS